MPASNTPAFIATWDRAGGAGVPRGRPPLTKARPTHVTKSRPRPRLLPHQPYNRIQFPAHSLCVLPSSLHPITALANAHAARSVSATDPLWIFVGQPWLEQQQVHLNWNKTTHHMLMHPLSYFLQGEPPTTADRGAGWGPRSLKHSFFQAKWQLKST